MINLAIIILGLVAVYYLYQKFIGGEKKVEVPRIVFNSPQVANKNEKVIEIVKAKLEAVEQAKAESEAMQLLSEIIPNSQASIAAKASK